MSLRSILVPLSAEIAPEPQLDAALQLARRLEAHINVLFLHADPADVYAALPKAAVAAGVTLEAIEREGEANAAAARMALGAWRARNGVPPALTEPVLRSTYAAWSERTGVPETVLARRGRMNDLIVLHFPESAAPVSERLFDAAVFDTARPVLLVPRRLPDDLLRDVVIAWNGSLEAARAVAGAMPLLHAAERVSVFSAPWHSDAADCDETMTDDLDLPEALVWHGVRARGHLLRPRDAGEGIGAALLREAVDHEATMLVMGGFTRSRVRGFLMGGVTRHVLRNPVIPVLMAH